MAGSDGYEVTRHVHVDGPPDEVLARIVDFRRWQVWSPWEDVDPAMRREYGGPEAGVGSWYTWDGNRKAGRGRMEIVAADAESVTIDLQFLKPFKSHSTTAFRVVPDGDGTEVRWTMTGPHTAMSRVMGIFTSMDKLIGPDFEKGLAQLKADVEGGADQPA